MIADKIYILVWGAGGDQTHVLCLLFGIIIIGL